VKRILILIIKAYQHVLSPLIPGRCRFYPSCSAFSIEAIERYGAILGLYCAVRRICKCHPFNPGGIDLVEKYEEDVIFKFIKCNIYRGGASCSGSRN